MIAFGKILPARKEETYAFIILSFAVFYSFYIVLPVLSGSEPYGEDNSYHFALTYNIVQGVINGNNVLDLWLPYLNAGHAVQNYYQHFPHIFTAFLYFLFLEKIPLLFIYKGVIAALLTFLPLSYYYGMKAVGYGRETSSLAGLMSLLISSNCTYGIDYCSFFGWGLFTQLFATFLFPLYIASVYRTVKYGQGTSLSVLLLCLVFTSHIIFGFMAVITACFFVLTIKNADRLVVSKRIIKIFFFAGLVLSYWIVPMYMNKDYSNNPDYSKDLRDSYGAKYVISGFFGGKLLDYGRLPVFSILVLIGLMACIFNRRERDWFLLAGFFIWTIFYIGKGDIWLLNFIPLSEYLVFFRFVNGFHFFAIMLAALGIHAFLRYGRRKGYEIVFIAIVFALLYPMIAERIDSTQGYIKTFDDFYLGKNRKHFDNVNTYLGNSEPGRILVGETTGLGTHFMIGLVPVYSGRDVLTGYSYSIYSPCFRHTARFNDSVYGSYDIFNVRYILAKSKYDAPDFARKVFESGRYNIYSVNTSGYFGFTGQGKEAYMYGSADYDRCGNIISEHTGYNYYSSVVDLQDDCSLFLKVAHHPNWDVYVDGIKKETFTVSLCFMGVEMDKGQHKVEFIYKASRLKSVLFIFGIAVIASLLLYDLWLARKARSKESKVVLSD